ncbi:MAG: DUF4142 domain-containing protein [Methylacidiphilales bacterium]|nr:DUF4142 domain-containing protein [Candidatus Methylacidiphilales bacterium]
MKPSSVKTVSGLPQGFAAALSSVVIVAVVICAAAPTRAEVVRSAPYPQPTNSFRQEVLFSSSFKIAASRLALEKSQNPTVRQVAEAVLAEQVPLRNELILNSHLLPPALPGGAQIPGGTNFTDRNRAAILQQLKEMDAASFDSTFGRLIASSHDATLVLFDDYSRFGSNGRMQDFAARNLPKVKAAFERTAGAAR